MKAIYTAIEAHIEANASHFTDQGLTAPSTVMEYNQEDQDEEKQDLPPRPFVSIEFDEFDPQGIEEGWRLGTQALTCWVMMDSQESIRSTSEATTKAKALDKLDYAEQLGGLLHGLEIEGDTLVYTGDIPDHAHGVYRRTGARFELFLRKKIGA